MHFPEALAEYIPRQYKIRMNIPLIRALAPTHFRRQVMLSWLHEFVHHLQYVIAPNWYCRNPYDREIQAYTVESVVCKVLWVKPGCSVKEAATISFKATLR